MANDAATRNAIASLNGTMVGNRTIRVNEAQPRTERSGGSTRFSGTSGDRPSRSDCYYDGHYRYDHDGHYRGTYLPHGTREDYAGRRYRDDDAAYGTAPLC